MEMPAFCGNTFWYVGNLICRGEVDRDCNLPNIGNDKRNAVLSFVEVGKFRSSYSIGLQGRFRRAIGAIP